MRVTEQLIIKNKESKMKRRNRQEEEEETFTYVQTAKIQSAMNEEKGIFQQEDASFHTEESIFNKTALFRTEQK